MIEPSKGELACRTARFVALVCLVSTPLLACAGKGVGPARDGPAPDTDAGVAIIQEGPAPSPDTGGTACERFCAVAATRGCPKQPTPKDCVDLCQGSIQTATQKNCGSQGVALVDCFARLTTDDFQCDGAGRSAIKAGVCAEEQKALAQCYVADAAPNGS